MELKPDITILYQFCQLLVLLAVLHFLVFKPVLKALAKRNLAVQSVSDRAAGSRQSVEDMGKAYDDTMKERRAPILDEREKLLKQAHGASMEIIEEARRDLTEELSKVKDAVRGEAEQTLALLTSRSELLAGEIVDKIMKRSA